MTDEELLDTPVMLTLGYGTKLLVSLRAATRVVGILSEENILKFDSDYSSGKSVNVLKPWGTDEIAISLISKAEILLRCAAGEKT